MMFCGMGLQQMTYDLTHDTSRIYGEVRCIQGYHVYQEIWDTAVDEVLPFRTVKMELLFLTEVM